MKTAIHRGLVIATALLLLLGAPLPVRGESAPADAPLKVLDSWWAAEAYQEQYPDRAIEPLQILWDNQGRSNQRELLLSGEWDAACIDTDDESLAALDRLGLTLPLNEIDALAALADDLYPAVRAGCSVGDKLVALPAGFLGTRMVLYRLLGTDYQGAVDPEGAALREQLGFEAEDQPRSFAEVCALGLRYMALSRETRKGTAFLFSDTAPQGFSLLYYMILAYQAEATAEDGSLSFDTPAFRAALQNAEPLLAAFAADPKRTYGADGGLSVVLCDEIGVQSYGAFPRVTEGDAIPAMMTVVIVNPNSPRLAEAIDYALVAAKTGDGDLPLLLYQSADYNEQLVKSYDSTIAAQREQGEAQAVIDKLEALKAAGDDKYFAPRSVFERYAAEVAPKLVFRRWFSFPMDSAIQNYLAHKLDEEGFIAALNEAAAEAR